MPWQDFSCSIRESDLYDFSLDSCSRPFYKLSDSSIIRFTGGKMLYKSVLSICLIAFLTAFSNPAFGQARDTASLFGTITDAQGALVPGARVTVTNPATGLSRSASTDTSGGFIFSLLPVGSYNLSVEQTGFRKYESR